MKIFDKKSVVKFNKSGRIIISADQIKNLNINEIDRPISMELEKDKIKGE